MKKVLLLIVVSTLILGAIAPIDVAAQSIETNNILLPQLSTIAVIHDNGSTSLIIDAKVENVGSSPISSANIRIDSLALNVTTVVSDSESTNFTMTTMDRHTMITVQFRNDLNVNESEWVHLEVQSFDIQSNLELDEISNFKYGSLVYYVRPHVLVTNYTFVAMLPAHASLSHKSSVPLFPEAETNFTDGQRIAFKWFVSQIQPGQERAFIVRYQAIDNSNDVVGVSFIVFGFVGLGGVLLGLGVAVFGPRLYSRIRRFGTVQYAGVTQEETIILETLQMKGGSCSQKELYSDLDISESKLSLLLGGLEEKGLIKRFREGRANIVHKMERS
ncbi:MAG: helix-turn-helix transcriptional regulator [Candidatus Thorarchaeota archaeon]|jgi:uncharacterized membrane protein